jgi:1-piperideine-2-carboxylate/1-pyrroline-2-carboxylate reductase [NAD(P)H]
MINKELSIFNAGQTAQLLDFPGMLDALAQAAGELAKGVIQAPERQVVPYPHDGVMLSMPATAADIGIHKLVNVVPSNRTRNVPTINGVVSVYDGTTGQPLFVLDGPTVTLRRTAAVSMLGLRALKSEVPVAVTLIGTGTQADGHVAALAALYPGCRVYVLGTSLAKAQQFANRHAAQPLVLKAVAQVPDDSDVVITLTTSSIPVYSQRGRADRLLIGVGAFKPELVEIGAVTLADSDLYVDDPAGARHEAGDFIQAGIDWARVMPVVQALDAGPARSNVPMVYKTVGCAAWDLAAARCALKSLNRG